MAEMNLKTARGFDTGTMVQSISVPPELRVKKSSGIKWVDTALGGTGGWTPTSCMMLTGGPGTGKSTLLRQLADTTTGEGHFTVYMSGEESLYQAKMACERMGLKNDFRVSEEKMLPRLLAWMEKAKADPKNAGKQQILLIDSLQTLDDGKYLDSKGNSRGTTGNTPLACTEMLVDWCQRTFGICVFIGQVGKGGEFLGKNGIKHAIDIHAHLWCDDREKSDTYGCTIFNVEKNRWGVNGTNFIVGLSKTGLEERGSFSKAGFAG